MSTGQAWAAEQEDIYHKQYRPLCEKLKVPAFHLFREWDEHFEALKADQKKLEGCCMIFKKKAKDAKVTGKLVEVGSACATEAPVQAPPKLKPACGYEFGGQLYRTAHEANLAYQRTLLKERFKTKGFTYTQGDYPWLTGALQFWEELNEFAHMKLEVE